MQTLPREDFPTLPEATGTYSATLPRDVLKQMVAKTQFAITGEDTRYFLNGALFILRPDSMSLVSTDGHRLALITVPRGAERRESESTATTKFASSCRARRCSSSDGCSAKAKATSSTSAARTTCSSRSAAGC